MATLHGQARRTGATGFYTLLHTGGSALLIKGQFWRQCILAQEERIRTGLSFPAQMLITEQLVRNMRAIAAIGDAKLPLNYAPQSHHCWWGQAP